MILKIIMVWFKSQRYLKKNPQTTLFMIEDEAVMIIVVVYYDNKLCML